MGHGYVDVPIPPACGVPPVTRRGLDAAVETATAAIRGVGRLLGERDRRRADTARHCGRRHALVADHDRAPAAEWATRHRVVRQTRADPPARLLARLPVRTSCRRSSSRRRPGHDSCIVDFSADQSQMRTIRAVGLDRLYSMDWIGATQATKDATISDYLAEIAASIDRDRRPGQPRRRLPGRLAGDDLRRAAPRGRQHAHDRRRPDRLPCRRRGHPRERAGALRRGPALLQEHGRASATAS